MNTSPGSKVLMELRAILKRIYGARMADLRLYGSRARGDATSDSDYDVLVILDDTLDPAAERRLCGDAIYDVCRRNDAVVMCHFVSRNRYEREQSPYMLNIRREGIAV